MLSLKLSLKLPRFEMFPWSMHQEALKDARCVSVLCPVIGSTVGRGLFLWWHHLCRVLALASALKHLFKSTTEKQHSRYRNITQYSTLEQDIRGGSEPPPLFSKRRYQYHLMLRKSTSDKATWSFSQVSIWNGNEVRFPSRCWVNRVNALFVLYAWKV